MLTRPIRRITISGFRGIFSPLDLRFRANDSARPESMCIYGANGTGKSSITDAWEWLQQGRIEHLRREGAEEAAYPHKDAHPSQTYVEVEFADRGLGTVCLEYDPARVTKPKAKGRLADLRASAPHRCQLRADDLTQFVYKKKAEKYDELGRLMGFSAQIDVQKSLRRVERGFGDRVQRQHDHWRNSRAELSRLLDLSEATTPEVLSVFDRVLSMHGLAAGSCLAEASVSVDELRALVENDPRAAELAQLLSATRAIDGAQLPEGIPMGLSAYAAAGRRLRELECTTLDELRVRIYEAGQSILDEVAKQGDDPNVCPLCGCAYPGDLRTHIAEELAGLAELRRQHSELEAQRNELRSALHSARRMLETLSTLYAGHEDSLDRLALRQPTSAPVLLRLAKRTSTVMELQASQLTSDQLAFLARVAAEWRCLEEALMGSLKETVKRLEARQEELENDSDRVRIVADHTLLVRALAAWRELVASKRRWLQMSTVQEWLTHLIGDYATCCTEDVQKRFDLISTNVERYFCLLEKDNRCLSRPVLRLLTDQDRAVELEVDFYGDPVYPAYKYLSESQLRSFGLSVFLASVRQFNAGFPFLILDDVINSFDAYKRPRVIELLRDDFGDHQVLVLTHDSHWYDDICNRCPTWIRDRFVRLERGIGPVRGQSNVGGYDRIRELIDEDRPQEAGRSMGPYLEQQLAELCECFEVLVKYNRRNQYTLEPLLSGFRSRVKGQLGSRHPLYACAKDMHESAAFRNLCAHWKDPAIEITSPEMREVAAKWEALHALVFCADCGRYLEYDSGSGKGFWCGKCHQKRLVKGQDQALP